MNHLRHAWILIALWGLYPAAPARAEPGDYVVAQVCVDAADVAVPGDPARCGHARQLRVGEAVPYRRVDWGRWQAFTSYPVLGPDGEARSMTTKVFGGADPSNSFGDLGERSGFDLIDLGGPHHSIIRTSDQGGGDQIFWRTTGCDRTDGWILFPPGLAAGQRGGVKSTLKITKGPSTACPWLFLIGDDYTTWFHMPEPYRYTSGRALDTIVSQHFAYGDPADPSHTNDSMERFYFTKPYGFTRWEAWQTPSGCAERARKAGHNPDDACRPYPEEQCNGPNTQVMFGKTYIRLDCRDDSFVEADPGRPFNPLVNDAAPGDVATRNLLRNPTFADGAADWRAAGGLQVTALRQPPANDAVLRVGCGPCTDAVLDQDFTLPAGRDATLRWGTTVAAATGRPVKGSLVLTLERDGAPPLRVARPFTVDGAAQDLAFALPWTGGAEARGRLAVVLDGEAEAVLDDAYVTPLPRGGAAAP